MSPHLSQTTYAYTLYYNIFRFIALSLFAKEYTRTFYTISRFISIRILNINVSVESIIKFASGDVLWAKGRS